MVKKLRRNEPEGPAGDYDAATFDDIVAPGENPRGIVSVGAYGTQKGTEPRDLLGRQEYAWNADIGGPNMGAFGPDFGMTDAEKERIYGPMPTMRSVKPGKPRKK